MALPVGNQSFEIKTDDALSVKLWHDCAGPLVTLPHKHEPVFYFPEGHMEHLQASIGLVPEQSLASFNLPSKILGEVDDVFRMVEPRRDVVFLKINVTPLPDDVDPIIPEIPETEQCMIKSFVKTLTNSDANTHGGFTVPLRHAEDCLPALDMSTETPSQILATADLCAKVWPFKHVYRGQPKRHLLTTGWSAFVNTKKLQAGDAGVNGDLRVGVRRVKSQQFNTSDTMISPQGVYMGLLATAAHSLMNKTTLSLIYKPRTMTPNFVVSVSKYFEGKNRKWSVGMRFTMEFEGEDAVVRRFSGTVVGVGANESLLWRNSEWKSLKVQWDEPFVFMKEKISPKLPEKVSPWEIDPLVANENIPPSQFEPPQWNERSRAHFLPFPTTGLRRFFAETPADEPLFSPPAKPMSLGHGEDNSLIGGPSTWSLWPNRGEDGAGPSSSIVNNPTYVNDCEILGVGWAEEHLKKAMKKSGEEESE